MNIIVIITYLLFYYILAHNIGFAIPPVPHRNGNHIMRIQPKIYLHSLFYVLQFKLYILRVPSHDIRVAALSEYSIRAVYMYIYVCVLDCYF